MWGFLGLTFCTVELTFCTDSPLAEAFCTVQRSEVSSGAKATAGVGPSVDQSEVPVLRWQPWVLPQDERMWRVEAEEL